MNDNDETQTDPATIQQTQEIRRRPKRRIITAILVLGFIACILILGNEMASLRTSLKEAKAAIAEMNTKTKAAEDMLAAKKKAEEVQLKAAQEAAKAKAAAEAALPKIGGTFAVVIGTLYNIDQRDNAAAKIVSAFGTCQHKGQPLTPCFVEVGNKSHTRFTTEVVAVPKTAMTEAEATALATCFDNHLPKLDSGKTVGAFASNLSSSRYAGRSCIK